VKCILASVVVSVRNWIFRPLLSLQYLNSAGINLNWRRTNLRKKEKQLSSQYDKYFGRVIIFWKDIIFKRENILKSDSIFLLRRDQMLCISVFMFFESVQAFFLPGHFWSTGRQIHNSWSYVFYVFLMFLCIYVCLYELDYVLRVPYSCGVVLVFLVLAGNSFWCYERT
jgi:hypothetical protein